VAILSVDGFCARTGLAPTGSDLEALTAAVSDVCDEIVRAAGGNTFERATYTDIVIDAPWNDRHLRLPQWPVSSITSLYLNWDAKGDSSAFTSADLLTNFSDYRLVIDDFVNAMSRRGKVEILTRPYWAMWQERPYGMLTPRPRNCPGCVKVSFVAGYAVPPDALQRGATVAAQLLYLRRKTGVPLTSSSWNGRSVSYDGAFTASAAIHSPDAWASLRHFLPQFAWA